MTLEKEEKKTKRTPAQEKAEKTRRDKFVNCGLRFTKEEKDMIDKAADIAETGPFRFMTDSILAQARKILSENP